MSLYKRFILNSKKLKKITCKNCGSRSHWVLYLDTETGKALPEEYGKCDNAVKCGAINNPWKDGFITSLLKGEKQSESIIKSHPQIYQLKPQAHIYLKSEYLEYTLKKIETNQLFMAFQNLRADWPISLIEDVFKLYNIGTIPSGSWAGACTFPFLNSNGEIAAIQVKKFDSKAHTLKTSFIHSVLEQYYSQMNKKVPKDLFLYSQQESKVSTFFGTNLLSQFPQNPIGLVEAPKSALAATMEFGSPLHNKNAYLFLATYNVSALNSKRYACLKNRKVTLFPDLKAENIWRSKMQGISQHLGTIEYQISSYLEDQYKRHSLKHVTDIADIILGEV